MKKMLFFSVMFLMGLATSFAQVPLNEQLTYQTVVRNAQNQLVYNQSNVSVTVYVCNLNATVVRYSETHTGLSTNPNGLLTLMVGGGTPATGSWNDIIWTDASIYTVISYNPGTGTVTITSDPAPVNAVPYALSAHVDCSVVVGCVDDAIENPTSTTNIAIDTVIENHLTPYEIKNCSDVTDCVDNAIADGSSTTNNAIDTVIENHLTPYEIKNCGDVTDCVDNAIADGSSTTNHAIDTVVSNIVHDSLVPYTIKNCDNVIACVDNAIADGTSTTNHAIDTVVAHSIHDSLVPYQIKNCGDVTDCVNSAIADGTSETNHAIDTVVSNIVRDSLVPYTIKNCGDVVDCVKTEIENGGSDLNHVIDTLAANNIHDSLVNYHIKDCADVMACPDIQRMRDSIQTNHTDIQTVQTELSTLETRVETFNTHVCDSVKDCVAAQIHDSLVAHPVYNSTITFHQEGETDQSITLNQSTNQTINIVTFSQKSARFIATAGLTDFDLTVPSGKTLDATDHLVQMYINGVYVGDTVDGVVKMSGTTAKYQPGSNGGYTLANDDRVNFVFWVK